MFGNCKKCNELVGIETLIYELLDAGQTTGIKCPKCGGEIVADSGVNIEEEIEKARNARIEEKERKERRKEKMKTPMGFYELIVEFLKDYMTNIDPERLGSRLIHENLRDQIRSHRYGKTEQKAMLQYRRARQAVITFRAKCPGLPDLPKEQVDPISGLQSIMNWCVEADPVWRKKKKPAKTEREIESQEEGGQSSSGNISGMSGLETQEKDDELPVRISVILKKGKVVVSQSAIKQAVIAGDIRDFRKKEGSPHLVLESEVIEYFSGHGQK